MLDRRSFLATTAGVLASPLFADERKPDLVVALVTDSHLGKPGADYVKRLRDTVAEINASPAAFTFFCGDLVDKGETAAGQKLYPIWLEIAKTLKNGYRAVPGNHDPREMFTRHLAPKTDDSVVHKGYRFVSFANAEPNPGHMGVVTPEQLKTLGSEFAEAGKKGERVVLIAHVAYHENKHPDVGWYIKEGRAEFTKLLEANKQIITHFSGHLHCGMRGWSDTAHGVHEVVLPCVSYNTDRKLDTAPGFAVKEFRPAWVLAEFYSDALVLKYKPVGAEIATSKSLPLKG